MTCPIAMSSFRSCLQNSTKVSCDQECSGDYDTGNNENSDRKEYERRPSCVIWTIVSIIFLSFGLSQIGNNV